MMLINEGGSINSQNSFATPLMLNKLMKQLFLFTCFTRRMIKNVKLNTKVRTLKNSMTRAPHFLMVENQRMRL